MSKEVNEERQLELIQQLTEICDELGWIVGVPGEEGSDSTVPGLIIGKEEFVYEIVEAFSGPTEYEIFEQDETGELNEKEPTKEQQTKSQKKREGYH